MTGVTTERRRSRRRPGLLDVERDVSIERQEADAEQGTGHHGRPDVAAEEQVGAGGWFGGAALDADKGHGRDDRHQEQRRVMARLNGSDTATSSALVVRERAMKPGKSMCSRNDLWASVLWVSR